MLEINNTQAKILRILIDNYRDDANKISIGLTANKLEKSYGIVSKTFRNNRDFFLKNYFLRLSAISYHGGKSYYYFQITRFGILAYLKWSAKQKFPFEFWLDRDFFPLLWKHWDELNDIYGEILPDIVQKATTYLEINHQYVITIKGKDLNSPKITEILTIPMGIIHIKLFSDYPVLRLQEIPTERSWGEEKQFQRLNQNIDNRITDRYTFLVYYSLLVIGLVGDFSLMFDHVVKKFLLKQDPTELDLENAKRELVEFVEKMKQNADRLFAIIKNDKELLGLMKSTLSEITESMNNRKPVKTIIERLE